MPDPSPTAMSSHRLPLRARSGTLRWFDRGEGRTLRLLLLGAVVAVLGTLLLAQVHGAPWTMQGGRVDSLNRTLRVLDQGGPLLTMQPPGSHLLYASGGGDDQGLYLLVPWVTHVLGGHDPLNLWRWMALIAFAITLLVYPWLIRELTGSVLAAVAAPFALLFGLVVMPLQDIYWVGAWVVLTLLPIMLLLDRRWFRGAFPTLLGILVVASAASAIRSQAGLPILLAAVLVLVRRPWSWRMRTGAVVLGLVAYLSVSTFAMAAVRAERSHQLDGRTLAGDTGKGHPLWHSAYIGLGYLPNQWDIRYYDLVAYRDVLRVDPKAKYLGPAYGGILRDRYFHLIGDDPGYAVKVYGEKLVASLRPASPALLVVLLAAPCLLLVSARRRRWLRDALFLGLTALIALLAPLIATPGVTYLEPFFATVLLAAILAVAAVTAEELSPRALVATLTPGAGRTRALAAVGVGVAVLLATVALAPGIQQTALDWQNSAPEPHVVQPPDATH
jgi:hypothetical protein